MAVSITSNFTLVDAADTLTDWGTDASLTLYSGFQREGSNCIGTQASNGAQHAWHTLAAATDLSNVTIFVWLKSGNPTAESSGGYRIVLGDGTNRIAYYVGGSDNAGFFAQSWSCFKLNVANRPTAFTALQGTEASLDTANITEVGGGWNYASKANGNADNVFIDIVRYVPNTTAALTVGGGTSGDRGTFQEIATQDTSTTNAWGICRNLLAGSNAFQINFGLEFGDATTAASYFEDSNGQVFLTGTNMASGAMDVALLANSSATQSFNMTNIAFIGIGTEADWNLGDSNFNVYQFSNCQFVNQGLFTFTTADQSRWVRGTTFNNCNIVSPSGTEFRDSTFLNAKDDGITISDPSTFDVIDCNFNNPTNHGVEITAAATYSFDGLLFSNTDGISNFDVENTTAGSVVINATGGSNPVDVDNSGGGTTTINNNTQITLTGLVSGTEVRVFRDGTTDEIAGEENASGSFVFTDGAGNIVDIRIFAINYEPESILDFTIPSNDASIPIDQTFDRNYSNP